MLTLGNGTTIYGHTVDELDALADEASRQNLSLACLIGAMENGEPIAWMEEYERRD